MSAVTERQLQVLRHSLGLNYAGNGRIYRNHFCAGGDDVETCEQLTAAGLMSRSNVHRDLAGGHPTFYVTDAGRNLVAQTRPATPRLSRSQRRYRAFLDADSGLSFGEWLKADRSTP